MSKNVDIDKKRQQEKVMLHKMISLYCRGNHQAEKGRLCDMCETLREYALMRTEKCPFMETKTFCSACSVHCYSREMQEQIRQVMRYAGPRMLFHHPVPAIRHMKVTLASKLKRSKNTKYEEV